MNEIPFLWLVILSIITIPTAIFGMLYLFFIGIMSVLNIFNSSITND